MTLIFLPFEHLHNENIKIPSHSFILSSHALFTFRTRKIRNHFSDTFPLHASLSTTTKFEPNFTVHLITSFPIA